MVTPKPVRKIAKVEQKKVREHVKKHVAAKAATPHTLQAYKKRGQKFQLANARRLHAK